MKRITALTIWLIFSLITPMLCAQEPAAPKEEKIEEPTVEEEEIAEANADIEDGYEHIERLTQILEHIRQNYVDEEKVSYESLVNSALEGMLGNLDPHCQYMYPKVFEQMKESQGNTYDGVGITISFKNNDLTIVAVREDGPAARIGILPGDQIIQINEVLADKIGLTEAIELLKGEPGQTLKLTVRRPATRDVLEFEMVREVMREETVKDVMMLPRAKFGDYQIGYLRLLQFNSPTARELATALDKLEDAGMEAFILDMRNNPGGLLNSAVSVCGEFLPNDTVVLTTEGRKGVHTSPPYRTSRKGEERTYPMAILVNHGSASGAEVVAGALQDLGRALVVGETSFGKGSVQSVMPVGNGAAMRLTTAKYYTPSKRTIHENGVTPNIIATLTPDEERDLNKWRNRANLPPAEARKYKSVNDRQLNRAVDALKGIIVYEQLKTTAKPDVKPAED